MSHLLIQVKSKEVALEWTKHFPSPAAEGRQGEIEVRQLFQLEDLGPSEAIERCGAASRRVTAPVDGTRSERTPEEGVGALAPGRDRRRQRRIVHPGDDGLEELVGTS